MPYLVLFVDWIFGYGPTPQGQTLDVCDVLWREITPASLSGKSNLGNNAPQFS